MTATTLIGVIKDALAAAGSVTALVPATSIWSMVAPEGTPFPRIVISEPKGDIINTFVTGKSLKPSTVTIDCYAEGAESANAIAAAVTPIVVALTTTFSTDQRIMSIQITSDKFREIKNRPKSQKPLFSDLLTFLVWVESG